MSAREPLRPDPRPRLARAHSCPIPTTTDAPLGPARLNPSHRARLEPSPPTRSRPHRVPPQDHPPERPPPATPPLGNRPPAPRQPAPPTASYLPHQHRSTSPDDASGPARRGLSPQRPGLRNSSTAPASSPAPHQGPQRPELRREPRSDHLEQSGRTR